MSDLEGKVALITGGGTGIGRGIARGFAREGMKLALAGLEHAPTADNQYESRHLGGYSAAQAAADEVGGDAFAVASITPLAETGEGRTARLEGLIVRGGRGT